MKSRIILHSFESLSFELMVAATEGEPHPTGGNRGPAYATGGPAATPLPPPPAKVPTWIISTGALRLTGSSHAGSTRATITCLGNR